MEDPASQEVSSLETFQSQPDPHATAYSVDSSAAGEQAKFGSIGPYRLLRKLGEGGMGAVWLAEQVAPVKRQVAVKVIAGYFGERERQRFDIERQSLAIMNHPAIAKVFDAGATENGQPYLVMEYVPGLRITTYSNDKQLGPRERVELMIKVCEGVQHAHQKAVMHRDLKPSNVLVVEVDGKPAPKIIDFGIAKAVEGDRSSDETALTMVGRAIGTPGYMSPEQADPGIADIDTRTDVYSLGVVLYELLTASLPFDPKQWTTKPLHEVLRQLHEEDPQSPSTRVSKDSEAAARNTGIEPQKLVRQLRGDLDWITLKSLENDRERRYSSPAELASDLQRYLRDEPVIARPPSVMYRAGKFVRRNRLAVGFTAVLMLLIAGFAVSMAIERNRARREAETSKRVADFMARIFTVADPTVSRGNSVTARELLDKASAQVETGLGQDPQVQGRLMRIMAETYRGLALQDQSQKLLEHAVAIQTKALGPDDPETLSSIAMLGVIDDDLTHYSDSEKLLRQALAGQQRVLGRGSAETLATANYLTDTLTDEGKLAEAEDLLRKTLALQQKTLGKEDGATLRTMRSLTALLQSEEHLPEAEKVGRETLALEQHALGPDHPGTLYSMNTLGFILNDEHRYPEAEKIFRETLAIDTRVLGPDHTNTRAALTNLAISLMYEGKLADAEATQRDLLARTRKILGPDHPQTLNAMGNLAITLAKEGQFDEAEKLLREAVATAMRTAGPTALVTRNAMGNLASTLAYAKRTGESIAMFEKLLEYASKAESPALRDAHYQYAAGLSVLGRKDEAFQQLDEAVKAGFDDADQLSTDDDLKSLREDPRFAALVEGIRKRQTSATK